MSIKKYPYKENGAVAVICHGRKKAFERNDEGFIIDPNGNITHHVVSDKPKTLQGYCLAAQIRSGASGEFLSAAGYQETSIGGKTYSICPTTGMTNEQILGLPTLISNDELLKAVAHQIVNPTAALSIGWREALFHQRNAGSTPARRSSMK